MYSFIDLSFNFQSRLKLHRIFFLPDDITKTVNRSDRISYLEYTKSVKSNTLIPYKKF